MPATALKTAFHQTPNGNQIVLDEIRGPGINDKKQVGEDINLAAWRFPKGAPVVKPLGSGLYEVRSSIPNGREFRCLFGVVGKPATLFFVDAVVKKTQKTPKARLELARTRLGAFDPS